MCLSVCIYRFILYIECYIPTLFLHGFLNSFKWLVLKVKCVQLDIPSAIAADHVRNCDTCTYASAGEYKKVAQCKYLVKNYETCNMQSIDVSPVAPSSEEVRKQVLEIKAETEENKICADCCHIGKITVDITALFAAHNIYMTSFRNSRVSGRVGISVSWGVRVHWMCRRPQTTQKRGAHRPLHPPRYLEQDTLGGEERQHSDLMQRLCSTAYGR